MFLPVTVTAAVHTCHVESDAYILTKSDPDRLSSENVREVHSNSHMTLARSAVTGLMDGSARLQRAWKTLKKQVTQKGTLLWSQWLEIGEAYKLCYLINHLNLFPKQLEASNKSQRTPVDYTLRRWTLRHEETLFFLVKCKTFLWEYL